jgi:hypothetical protein
MNVQETIERARAKYDEVVFAMAKKVHQEQVVPICNKYGYSFSAGMGSWSFALKHDYREHYPSTPEEAEKLGLPELADVLRILSIDVYSFNHGTTRDEICRLGYYVADAP